MANVEITPDLVENKMISLALIQRCIVILEDENPVGEDYKNRLHAARVGEQVIKYMNVFFGDSQVLDEADKKAFKNFRNATWELLTLTERKQIMQENRRKEAIKGLSSLAADVEEILRNREQKDTANVAKMGEQLLGIADMLTVLATMALRAHTLPDAEVDVYNQHVNKIVEKFSLHVPITVKYNELYGN